LAKRRTSRSVSLVHDRRNRAGNWYSIQVSSKKSPFDCTITHTLVPNVCIACVAVPAFTKFTTANQKAPSKTDWESGLRVLCGSRPCLSKRANEAKIIFQPKQFRTFPDFLSAQIDEGKSPVAKCFDVNTEQNGFDQSHVADMVGAVLKTLTPILNHEP